MKLRTTLTAGVVALLLWGGAAAPANADWFDNTFGHVSGDGGGNDEPTQGNPLWNPPEQGSQWGQGWDTQPEAKRGSVVRNSPSKAAKRKWKKLLRSWGF